MFVCAECGQRYDRGGYCAADGRPLGETDDPLLGTEVGRYRLARLLGEGGMGRVYLAVQPMIGSRVAIKILSEQCAKSPELLERFFAEARAVNLIKHEGIVSVIDMAQLPDGRPFIVMEYIEGRTLAAVVHAGQVPLGAASLVTVELLAALGAAHAIGIVHRDLKPDNVIVTNEGHARVLDFGIAKLAPQLSAHVSPRTRTGALLGTPTYMAPEQISGAGTVDARADLYAVGVVLFEVATGRVPFAGATLFDLMRAHVDEAPPLPRALRPDLPEAFEQVILTALAKDPAKRFQSAAAMAAAVHHAAAALPEREWRPLTPAGGGAMISGRASLARFGPPTPPRIPSPLAFAPTTAARKQRRTWLVVAVLAVLAVVAVIVGIAMRGDAHEEKLAASEPAPPPPVTATQPQPAPVQPAPVPVQPAPVLPAGAPPPPRAPKHAPPDAAPAAPPDASGPTIVGGGSAADHGVIIGPGVTMGPGVVIGGATPAPTASPGAPTTASHAADYDAKHFDPIAYLPKARAIARQLLDDADFTELEFYENAWPDGHVDLTLPASSTSYYEFRSAKRSMRPADVPRGSPVEMGCYVAVHVTARGVEARIREDSTCDHATHVTPRCRFADVWRMALAAGEPGGNAVATIGYLHDGTWFFDMDHAGNHPGTSSVRSFRDCH